jgi:hypothetical protein
VAEIERLFVIRIRDPETRGLVRGRLANSGATTVTDNIWEIAASKEDDAEMYAQYWEKEMRWFEETIDPRTDVIYIWSVVDGAMMRSAIGGGK